MTPGPRDAVMPWRRGPPQRLGGPGGLPFTLPLVYGHAHMFRW